jgi:adenylosuccinate lyase
VERIVLPDSTIALDYLLHLATYVVEHLRVFPDRMRANLEAGGGLVFSQQVLLALIEQGRSREEAYRLVQDAAAATWDQGASFREEIVNRTGLSEDDVDDLFRPRLDHLDGVFASLEKLEVDAT